MTTTESKDKTTTANDWDQSDDDWDEWSDAEESLEKKDDLEKRDAQNTNEKNKEEEEPKKSKWEIWPSPLHAIVSTASGLTSSVINQGLNHVMGFPEPEELARINSEQLDNAQQQKVAQQEDESTKTPETEQQTSEQPNPATTHMFGSGLFSGVTNLGSKVINTGLDTLEGIGKKTMNILQENDPLLMNKRKLLGLEPDRPNLSEILKEAKRESDDIENTLRELKIEKNKSLLRFEVIFENSCGLVHLEALEILSKESILKLQKLKDSVSGNALTELQETVDEVKELLELEDLEGETEGDYTANELNEKLQAAIEDAELKINFDDIVKIWSESIEWISTQANDSNEADTFAKAVTALAETCALEINKLHKISELLLVKEHHSTANEVDGIVQLCKQFNIHLNGLTNRYATVLTATNSSETKTHISTLFAEMLLATQQIEKAFKLFLPILQIGAV